MTIQRRTVLTGTAAVAGGAVLGGPFQGFVAAPAGALGAPAFRGLRAVPDLRDGTVRLHLPEGFTYRSFHDTEFPVTLDDGTNLPGRHDGMAAFPGRRRPSHPGPQPRGQRPRRRLRTRRRRTTPTAGGGTTTVVVDHVRRGRESCTSLNGTQMNCAGGRMPWGSLDHLRGDGQRPGRRARLHRRVQHRARRKPHGFIFEVPADGQSEPRADHPGRPVRPRVGRLRPASTGILYLTEDNFGFPSGFYRYIPKTQPDATTGPPRQRGPPPDAGRHGVSPTPTSRRAQAQGAPYHVEWVDIDDPDPTFPYTPGQTAPTTNDRPSSTSATRDGPRARRASPASRAPSTTTASSTSPPPRVAVRAEHEPGHRRQRLRQRLRPGLGLRPAPRRCSSSTSRPGARTSLDFPDNITVQPPRHPRRSARTTPTTTTCAASSRGGQLFDIALNRLDQQPGATVRRRVRRVDVQPGRAHAVRQHPGQPRHDVRDLGTLGADRRLSVARARHPAWWGAGVTRRRGPPCARPP